MGTTEAPATAGKKTPPALFLVRARSRASRVADLGDAAAAAAWPGPPDTPPRRSPVTVPFLWEEAPGKPKAPPSGDTSPASAVPEDVVGAANTTPAAGARDHDDSGGGGAKEVPRPMPLKLPPRLQQVPSAKQRDSSLSPKTVLHGPYYGCAGGGKRPPRRTASGFAAFRRTPSFNVGLFSRSKATAAATGSNKNKGGGGHQRHLSAAAPDIPWCSPAASSASSSSSSSLSTTTSCFGDDHGHGHAGHRRTGDVREDGSSEEDECANKGSVRIRRLRRNRSLPSITTSHLWVCPRLCSSLALALLSLLCLACSAFLTSRNQRWDCRPLWPCSGGSTSRQGQVQVGPDRRLLALHPT
ncbi:hypothetical protein BAE44_0014950 [Dichanthelium oligosanthes]|uniref:Uncharacterized protein n=1 Tax=Dichanthelium oligosanthes TaxID=888268 RepID=A0A1E5VFZ0_9POAL|nr:hypothetical protein BAE44_0014950 [Dichanthelium oligosanthes]